MKNYIGSKLLRAEPMNLGEYNALRGWDLPANEDGAAPGYLVEYLDGGAPNVPGYSGYVSWSPKNVFEKHYRAFEGENQALNYADAINLATAGAHVARQGWNGKGMFVFLVASWRFSTKLPTVYLYNQYAPEQFLAIKTAQNTIIPWVASQADQLATDWQVIRF